MNTLESTKPPKLSGVIEELIQLYETETDARAKHIYKTLLDLADLIQSEILD